MSPEEAALLAAVAARPTDHLGYLVYADWLDERADPRGEFLRLSAHLLETAARLAELKPTLPPDWVAEVDLLRHAVEPMILPPLGDVGEGMVRVLWTVRAGDRVAFGGQAFEVETEHAIVSLPSEVEGVVVAVLVRWGDLVRPGALLAVVLRL